MSEKPQTSNRVALVTGATSGIGQWTVLGLVKARFSVIAVGRDRTRAKSLVDWVRENHSPAGIETMLADLSSMSEVRRLALDVRDRASRLDLLVNNAGLYRNGRSQTRERHETMLAVNHLAPFLLTRELLPLLQSVPGSRIVNVGSSSADKAAVDLDDLEWRVRPWSGFRAYGQSKLAMMLTSFALSRQLGVSTTVNVVHPGAVGTRIGDIGGGIQLVWSLLKAFLLTPEKGSRTTLRVATDPALAKVTGRYFKKSAEAVPNPLVKDERLSAEVWSRTEALLRDELG